VASTPDNLAVERITQHYLQGSTIQEILVGPDPRDGLLVALVVPDLEHFRQTGETDIWGEVQWQMDYYSQQLPPGERVRAFVLTNQKLPRPGDCTPAEITTLFYDLTAKRRPGPLAATAEMHLPLGEKVVRLLQRQTGVEFIGPDTGLGPDLGLDSLALVELRLALEDAFRLKIDDADFIGIFTVGELISFLAGQHPRRARKSQPKKFSWQKILQAPPPPALLQQITFAPGLTGRLANLGAALWLRLLFKLFFDLRVYGRERLGPGGYILCPNHGSFFDGFLLFATVPQALRSQTYFLGYNNYFDGPMLSRIAELMHVVPVNSARHLIPALRGAAHILTRGGALGIFPEGARSLTGELRPFKNGVAVLAREVGVPLVPVYIHGSFQAWGPNAPYPWPHPIQIIFGRQFSAEHLEAAGRRLQPGIRTYAAIMLGLRQEILNLKDELRAKGLKKARYEPGVRLDHP
jgi:long-chain acyl-CoA synthetase